MKPNENLRLLRYATLTQATKGTHPIPSFPRRRESSQNTHLAKQIKTHYANFLTYLDYRLRENDGVDINLRQ